MFYHWITFTVDDNMSVEVALADLISRSSTPVLAVTQLPAPIITSVAKEISELSSVTSSEHCIEPTSSSALMHRVDEQSASNTTEYSINEPSTSSAYVNRVLEPSNIPVITSAVVPGKPFPFNNSSSPTDIDSDILPYHFVNVEKKASGKKQEKCKFFVLTSAEVLAKKKKAARDKELKEEEKIRRLQERAKRLEMKELIQKEREIAKATKMAKVGKSKKIGMTKSSAKMTVQSNQEGTADAESEYLCIYCNEKYAEPITEDWIMCSSCKEWCHEKCVPQVRKKRGKFICDNCA